MSPAGMAEPARTADGLIQRVNPFPYRPVDRSNNQLSDAIPAFNLKRIVAVIDEYDLNFAAVVCINRSGCIHHGNAVAQGKSAARPHLGFGTRRKGNTTACGHQCALTGWNREWRFDRCP